MHRTLWHHKFASIFAATLAIGMAARANPASANVPPLDDRNSKPITITKVIPNDDSVLVEFLAVQGAVDYRIYDVANPTRVKYAGQSIQYVKIAPESPLPDYSHYSIEWNGLDPDKGATLIVEALDSLGPFQSMDKDIAPGALIHVNGHGNPTNAPNVIAKSDPFVVNCAQRTYTGTQRFVDNFRSDGPFIKTGNNPHVNNSWFQFTGEYIEWDNGRWIASAYGTDPTRTTVFIDRNHLMNCTADNNATTNASTVLQPKAQWDISKGASLHVTFEVDAKFTGRRWVNLIVKRAGDPISNAGKLDSIPYNWPTVSGDEFRWEIKDEFHFAQLFKQGIKTEVGNLGWADFKQTARLFWDHSSPLANGTMTDIDKRHRFDLYLSKMHFTFEERDGFGNLLNRQDRDFPDGMQLPFDQCEVAMVHQVYHTALEHVDLTNAFGTGPNTWQYWVNEMPYEDERHWDNFAGEVLGGSTGGGGNTDTTNPTVNITKDGSNTAGAGTVVLHIRATDNVRVKSTEIALDSIAVLKVVGGSADYVLDTAKLADGDHTIVARASDAAGNVGSSSPLKISVLNAPAVNISSPGNNSIVSNWFRLAFDANTTTKRVVVKVDGIRSGNRTVFPASLNLTTKGWAPKSKHTIELIPYNDKNVAGTTSTVTVSLK